ncbi:MAG TPA: tetratricopeptide repeat protein [Candidatus Babeliales bacterium]|nr:tetratricopeptide repeat protein [Candidatus Babeliales bacterium]
MRWALGAIVAVTLVALGIVQLASDALSRNAAAEGTIPRAVSPALGIAVYRALDRLAPAPYVEEALAAQALDRGDADAAQRYAVRLPASPMRDELLARVALLRGRPLLAQEYFLAAPDPDAINSQAQALAFRDPAAAYALEGLLRTRLAHDRTHPDAVAQADWEMGLFANRQAWRQIPGSALQRAWLQRGFRDFDAAVALAPFSERYLVAAANQADLAGDRRRAQQLFGRAAEIDPLSADAIAGLGVVAWESGDRAGAQRYLARARAIDQGSLMVRALERDLR